MRAIGTADLPALLALNNAHATELSFLAAERFERLVGLAFFARCTDEADGFILAFDERADYDSPNFLWFRTGCRRFVYVDRVVVIASRRGAGIASCFYDALEREARAMGQDFLGCEVNISPPNPASDAFHARRGFATLGEGMTPDGAKTVRFLGRTLRDRPVPAEDRPSADEERP